MRALVTPATLPDSRGNLLMVSRGRRGGVTAGVVGLRSNGLRAEANGKQEVLFFSDGLRNRWR